MENEQEVFVTIVIGTLGFKCFDDDSNFYLSTAAAVSCFPFVSLDSGLFKFSFSFFTLAVQFLQVDA